MSLTSTSKKQSMIREKTGSKNLSSNIGIRKKICFGYILPISIATLGILTGRIFELNNKHQIRGQIEEAQEQVDLLTKLTTKALKINIIQKERPKSLNDRKVLEAKISQELSSIYEINTIFKQLQLIPETGDESIEKKYYIPLQEFIQSYLNPLTVYLQGLENLVQEIKQIPPKTTIEVESLSSASLSKINNSEVAIKLEKLSQDSENLTTLFNQRVEQGFRDYKKTEALGIKILIGSLLLSIIIAVMMAIYTSRSIVTPLKDIIKVAQQVTEEANFELQLTVTTKDEIGQLTLSLNELIDKVAKYTEQLQEAKLKAEAANRSKSAFLATMSHELRTPLNAIIGYSEILYEEAEDAGYQDFMQDLDRIRIAGKHLLEMISDILDISKIEAGQVTLYLESIEVEKLVQDVVGTAKNLTEKNRNTFKLLLGENLGTMYADMPKVRQVLINLLGNAAKFTEDGLITLSVERVNNKKLKNYQNQNLQSFNSSNGYIVFRVIDTGIGMTEDQLKHIFQPFTQADASTTRRYGGTGLGLAICQRLCERMGARIYVKSKSEEGSTFTVWFPEKVMI
ncbi:HAMP domain-containing protein [Okeania hirsuta]|uniref:Circadian input-output histidine kinase CikA n=1 Tax=Okeania hirsuta TaxID=1458930 RepID=A0A3N6NX31_9CYAN|nr:ATP-binding protein [Okeania sp. SIO1F9]RQH16956.1 HAMP domain-containing protein [Okeania hirsuta]RQH29184.1 HAMP domain-containing protein [Okeania hirsuta]